jgi:hypothetical protein
MWQWAAGPIDSIHYRTEERIFTRKAKNKVRFQLRLYKIWAYLFLILKASWHFPCVTFHYIKLDSLHLVPHNFRKLYIYSTVKTKCWSVLLTRHSTFEIVTFIVISESIRFQISSLSSPTLMKRGFKTTSTSKRPDVSTWTISRDDSNGRTRLNYLDVRTPSDSIDVS